VLCSSSDGTTKPFGTCNNGRKFHPLKGAIVTIQPSKTVVLTDEKGFFNFQTKEKTNPQRFS
jgi:hypothetical protein